MSLSECEGTIQKDVLEVCTLLDFTMNQNVIHVRVGLLHDGGQFWDPWTLWGGPCAWLC